MSLPHRPLLPGVFALLTLGVVATAQDTGPDAVAAPPTLERVIDPVAKELWDGFLAASRPGDAARDPIRDFSLAAWVRVRNEGSNDVEVLYDFQSPQWVRSSIQSGKTIGRGPGRQGLSGYWLMDREAGGKPKALDTTAHARDRRQIDDLVALAKNFVALSDPSRLKLDTLVTSEAPAALLELLPRRAKRKLVWIRLRSTDFGLSAKTTGTSRFAAPKVEPRWVEFGLDEKTLLPRMLLVGKEHQGRLDLRAGSRASLIHLPKESFQLSGGFLIPEVFHLHDLVPHPTTGALVFSEKAAKEIILRSAEFRPSFPPGHFDGAS